MQDSFSNGISLRELRLSSEELTYVKQKFPGAAINRISTDEDLDEKAWYEVNLSPANDVNELEAVQLENDRLKHELEQLKSLLETAATK